MEEEPSVRELLDRVEKLEFEAFCHRIEEQFATQASAATSDGLMMILGSESGRIVYCDEQVARLFGYQRYELRGRPVEDLAPIGLREGYRKHRLAYNKSPVERTMAQAVLHPERAVRRDGTEFALAVTLKPLLIEQRLVISMICSEVEEQDAGLR